MCNEIFISVDVETSGPIPGEYSLLSIGACLAANDSPVFECLVKPINDNFDPEAMKATGISFDHTKSNGLDASIAMTCFRDWIRDVSKESTPIFVGFNSPFDWSFINYYFHKYLGENPFGFTALDIKSMYFGRMGGAWKETRSSVISKQIGVYQETNHDALKDAQYQAKLFQRIRKF